MHTVQLKIQDNIYSHIMFLLNNLNLKGLEIKEDKQIVTNKQKIKQLLAKSTNVFADIKDPLEWQKKAKRGMVVLLDSNAIINNTILFSSDVRLKAIKNLNLKIIKININEN